MKFFLILMVSIDLMAMVAEPTRVSLWRRGESIAGEEFLSANESIIDYLNTLPRPTKILEAFRYQCKVKSRRISLAVYGGGSSNASTAVRMVYELRDCVKE